jgi:hypothetical protein
MYHLLFSNSRGNSALYKSHFTSYDKTKIDENQKTYSGHGAYSSRYVSRMRAAVAEGRISFETSDGHLYKSSQFAGKSKSSITGKSISRGGFGSRWRAMGVSS